MSSEKVKIYIMVIGAIERLEKEAAEMNETSSKYAREPEKLKAVQGRGITIDNAMRVLETDKYHCILINAPGHPNFNENMIKDALQANCVILIVDSTVGNFEVGTSRNVQTYEHAYLAAMLGIKQIICCVDKMDATNPGYSKERYDETLKSISSYLKMNGYDLAKIPFVPISGFEGDNLIERSPNLPWYKGPTLHEALDQIQVPKRPIDKPLRLPIEYVNRIDRNVTMGAGCVETGSLKPETKVIFGPTGVTGKVKSIDIDNKSVQEAFAGDAVRCNLKKIDAKDLKPGYVASDPKDDPAKEAISFKSEIIIIANHLGNVVFEGYTPIIDFGSYRGAVKIEKFLCKIDPTTGEVEQEPKLLQNGDAAIVEMVPQKPMVVEPFGEYPPLGRFVIRNKERIVGVGVVESVEKKEYPDNEGKSMKSALKEGAKLFGAALVGGAIHIAGTLTGN